LNRYLYKNKVYIKLLTKQAKMCLNPGFEHEYDSDGASMTGTPPKRFKRHINIALILLGLLATAIRPQEPAAGSSVVKAESVRVVVPVTVTATDGEMITGLRKENFRLYVRNAEITRFQFLHNTDLPLVIGYVFDHSSRSVMNRFSWNKQVVQSLIHQFGFEDVFFLGTYGTQYAEVQKPTSDRLEILATLSNLHPYMFSSQESIWSFFTKDIRDYSKRKGAPVNKTAIALDHALYSLAGYDLPKKALILVSDGDENLSDITLNHVQRYGVPVYALYFSGSGIGGQSLFKRGQILRTVSQETGGCVFENLEDADPHEIGRRLSLVIRNQYLISFEPSEHLNRTKTHPIRIVLDRADANVVYRKSFRFVKE